MVISLLSGEVISVDLGQQKLTMLLNNSTTNLPTISLSYTQSKIILLGLDHSIRLKDITNNLDLIEVIDTPDLTFSIAWLTSMTFISCSFKNEFIVWKIQNNKLLKDRIISEESVNDDTHNITLISTLKVWDQKTILVGDLKGNVYTIIL